jgi:RNase H-like domain found in reverse transcriptase
VKASAITYPTIPKESLLQEVVIGYYSKLDSVQDAKMAPVELECQTVVIGLLHFKPYIRGVHTTVVTDAAALKWYLHFKMGMTSLSP